MKIRNVRLGQAFAAALILILVMTGLPLSGVLAADGAGQQTNIPPIEMPVKGRPKLDSLLGQLAAARSSGGPAAAAALAEQRSIDIVDGRIRVVIEAVPGKVDSVLESAGALGADSGDSYENLVRVSVPVSSLIALSANPAVRLVRQPMKPVPLAVSEGVSLIGADVWHSAGATGSGVKIGILDIGFSGYAGLLGTELPSSVTTNWLGSGGTEGTDVHGTACAEIIYDLAPDADYYLTNIDDDLDWGPAVDWLIAQGVDVISCSLGWINTGPGDGTGFINEKVTDARNAGIIWAQSAGNQAQRHWMGTWVDTIGDNVHEFNPGVDETNAIYATPGDLMVVGLKWDDPWSASTNDYDLYLLDNTLNAVARSENWQNGFVDPTELLAYTATYAGYYHIVITEYSSSRAANFHLFTFRQNLQYQAASNSLMEPADSPDAMTVGAVDFAAPGTIENFSSQGPTLDYRTKPDLAAPDGVTTSSYGPTAFYGTSAAAPHAAGAAALLKGLKPSLTPGDIQAFLEGHAVDLGASGKDNQFGAGRLQLGAIPDFTPPSVVSTSPGDAAIAVSAGTTVSATFDEDINPVTLTFTLDSVSGNVTYDDITYTATFTPDASLDFGTLYTASVSASDTASNPMTVPHTWSFTTTPPGDADEDGDVDVFDWVKVKRIILGLDDHTPPADADRDGDVDVFDWVKVKRIILGLEP